MIEVEGEEEVWGEGATQYVGGGGGGQAGPYPERALTRPGLFSC